MTRIIKETTTKTHRYDELGIENVLEEIIMQYYYDTEEEKINHCERMKQNGFTDSGMVKDNIGSLNMPKYVWFGSYYKHTRKC